MNQYWSPLVHNITPYTPGEQPKLDNLIKLNTNENPYPPSPKVLEALRGEIADSLRLYPDPNADRVKAVLAAMHALTPQHIFAGNGSDEVLAFIFQALLKHDRPVLFPDVTYSFYPVYCRLYEIKYQAVPVTAGLDINIDGYQCQNGGIIFPNPNAPTGLPVSRADIERLLARNTESVVVLDEAYVDFGAESSVPLVQKYPNLVVVQTLSKAYSLAGLRVGFAIGHPELMEALERVKNSFNSYPLSRFAITGATAALEDRDYFEKTRQQVIRTRDTLGLRLAEMGFSVLPSKANFIFARHPYHNARDLAERLRKRSVIVRHFSLPKIEQYLRITVGTDRQCAALLSALTEILAPPSLS
ncbi:MAG: histidinol-phosphate transaminase [Syntrophobacterales bacterium]|jgi:histidinol-phosphate aminotransferase|nr:histidinol-phosphate transaminase [Syntrophobacterales bacterium]